MMEKARYARIDVVAVLDVALKIAAEDGAGRLTLDAVAAHAGVSKGGLLYRFPTKDALLAGMVDRLNAVFDEAIAAAQAEPGVSTLEAYVEAALTEEGDHDAAFASVLAVAAESPALIERFREPQRRRLQSIVKEGAPFAEAAEIMLAADGLWLSQLVGFNPLTDDQCAAVKAHLRQRARALRPQ